MTYNIGDRVRTTHETAVRPFSVDNMHATGSVVTVIKDHTGFHQPTYITVKFDNGDEGVWEASYFEPIRPSETNPDLTDIKSAVDTLREKGYTVEVAVSRVETVNL